MSNRTSGATRIVALLTIGSIINLALGLYGFFGDLVFGLPSYYDYVRTSRSGFFPSYFWQELVLEMSLSIFLIGVAVVSLYAAYRLYNAEPWSHSLALVFTTTTVLIYFAAVFFFELMHPPDVEFLGLRQLVGSYLVPFIISIVWAGVAWVYLYAGARREPPSRLWYVVPFLYGVIGGLVAFGEVKKDDRGMAAKLLLFGMIWSLILVFALYAFLLPSELRTVGANWSIELFLILLPMLQLILLEIAGCVMWLRSGRAKVQHG